MADKRPTPKTRAQEIDEAVSDCVADCGEAFARLYSRVSVIVPREHALGLAVALEPFFRELATCGRACMDAADRDRASTRETPTLH